MGVWRRAGHEDVRLWIFGACKIERRPRGASQHKAAPTSVSGQLFLRRRRAPIGVHLDFVPGKQGGRVHWHRRYWPETDVGAALCCEAPRGRRSISQAPNLSTHAPQAHTNQKFSRSTVRQIFFIAERRCLAQLRSHHSSSLRTTCSRSLPATAAAC